MDGLRFPPSRANSKREENAISFPICEPAVRLRCNQPRLKTGCGYASTGGSGCLTLWSKSILSDPAFAHQLHYATRNGIRSCAEHRVREMGVAASGALCLVTQQRAYCWITVAKVGGKGCEAVPQYVRSNVRWQLSNLGEPRPKLFKMQ